LLRGNIHYEQKRWRRAIVDFNVCMTLCKNSGMLRRAKQARYNLDVIFDKMNNRHHAKERQIKSGHNRANNTGISALKGIM
jgi:hypothetical protein